MIHGQLRLEASFEDDMIFCSINNMILVMQKFFTVNSNSLKIYSNVVFSYLSILPIEQHSEPRLRCHRT